MKSSRISVVDVGACHVAVAEFAITGPDKMILQEFAQQTQGADPALDAGWVERTAQALSVMATASRTSGAVRIAIPGYLALTKFIKTLSVAAAKRGKIIEFEASQAIPYLLAEVVWEHAVLADDGRDLEMVVTAAKRDPVERICAAAKSAGYRVISARASAHALESAFRWNYSEVTASVLVVDIGARTTTLMIGGPDRFHVRTLPIAGNTITTAIAADFQLDFAQTELLKIRVLSADQAGGQPGRPAVQRATGNFIAQLQLEIARSITNHLRQAGATPPAIIYLTGGGSLMSGLEEALAKKFQCRVERYDPFRKVELSPHARAAGAAASGHLLANLVGLARTAVTSPRDETGLLPPAIREEQAFRRRQPLLLGVMALLAVALLSPVRYYHRLAQLTAAQAAEINAQLQPLQQTASRNARHLAEIKATQERVAVIRRLVEAKSTWVEFLADLQQRLGEVEDGWLDQLAVVPSTTAASGLELTVSGRLLDTHNPVSKVSPESDERARQLLVRLAGSPFVTAVRNERFDNSQPGLLRFDCTLAIDPRHPL